MEAKRMAVMVCVIIGFAACALDAPHLAQLQGDWVMVVQLYREVPPTITVVERHVSGTWRGQHYSATLRRVTATEICGTSLLGGDCYAYSTDGHQLAIDVAGDTWLFVRPRKR
jgi:hypothetical protein